MSATSPIRTGVLGLGRAGYDIHLRNMRKRDDFKVVAVADPNTARCQEAAAEFGCATFPDLDSLLKGSDAEFIIVATASSDHAAHSIRALEAGRHVLVEKPMATTLRDADRMLEVQRKSGKILTVHQSYRWSTDFAFVRRMLHDERLGEVFFIRRGSYAFAQRNDWQTLRKYGGGVLFNKASHDLDQCLILMEAPVKGVWGDLKRILQTGDTEDHALVVMRGENGRVIEMEASMACAISLPNWVVLGTRGSLIVWGEKAKLRYAKCLPDLPQPEDAPIVHSRRYGVQGDVPPLEFEEIELAAKADLGPSFYDRLSASLRKGAELAVKPEQCRAVLEVIARARQGTNFPG